jgi:hypothetical protein
MLELVVDNSELNMSRVVDSVTSAVGSFVNYGRVLNFPSGIHAVPGVICGISPEIELECPAFHTTATIYSRCSGGCAELQVQTSNFKVRPRVGQARNLEQKIVNISDLITSTLKII